LIDAIPIHNLFKGWPKADKLASNAKIAGQESKEHPAE
jgi:hypothetical protein